MNILIIDSDEINAETSKCLLELYGFNSTWFNTLAEGIKEFQTGNYDLLWIDYNYRTSKEALENHVNSLKRKNPVIIVSTIIETVFKKEFNINHDYIYFLKPYRLDDIANVLKGVEKQELLTTYSI